MELVDSLLDISLPSDIQLSPDGTQIAYAYGKINRPDAETPHQSSIHIFSLETNYSRPLPSASHGRNLTPRWSPDGEKIVFTKKHKAQETTRLYLTDRHGQYADAISRQRANASAPQWLPSGTGIVYISQDQSERADPYIVDAQPNFARLMLIDLKNGREEFVTPATHHIHEFSVSPDGQRILALASQHLNPFQGWYHAKLYLLSLDSGAWQSLSIGIEHQLGRLCWSPDGRSIAFVGGVCSDEGNVAGELYTLSLTSGRLKNQTAGIDHSITWIDWQPQGILYGARRIAETLLAWLNPDDGNSKIISRGEYAINAGGPEMVSVRGNRFAAIRESHTEPPQLYWGSLEDGEWHRLTAWRYPTDIIRPLLVENRHWEHNDGTPTHAYLALPEDGAGRRPLPMVVNVHGGPSLSIIPRYFNPWVRIFLSLGCAVLLPNPRGSWGRGHAYQAANIGDLGGGDWQDILAGIDLMTRENLADSDRLAIMGWSYAGFLTTWAITQTQLFRCAIAGANITNFVSNYGVVLNREWQSTMFGSNVYEDIDLHWSRSPIRFAHRVHTPTLLVHGAEDIVAPPEQSIEFHTALRHFGIPTELVLYPREPHGLQERNHQRDLMLRMRRWLKRYLLSH